MVKTQAHNYLPAALLPASRTTAPTMLSEGLTMCLFLLELCGHEAGEALPMKTSALERGAQAASRPRTSCSSTALGPGGLAHVHGVLGITLFSSSLSLLARLSSG